MRITSFIFLATLPLFSIQPHKSPLVNSIRLSTIPHRVYKESNDQEGSMAAEKWTVYVLVNDSRGRALTPTGAAIALFSGDRPVETLRLSGEALAAAQSR